MTTIAPHRPATATLSLWRNAPSTVAFELEDGTPSAPVNLTGVVVGLTMTGLAAGGSLTLRSDAPGPQSIDDRGSYLQITNAADGQVTLTLGADDAQRIQQGQRGQWRLWLALSGGEVPLIFGTLEGSDYA